MYGLIILGFLVTWLAIAFGVGKLVYRTSGKRSRQIAAIAFMLWLPFWDVIPGYIAYRNAVEAMGGVRIARVVEADGYLDATSVDCYDCWQWLLWLPYDYLEIQRTFPIGPFKDIERMPGFYEYRLTPRSSPECARVQEYLRYFDSRGLRDHCVTSTRRDQPISRYVVDLHSWRGLVSNREARLMPEVEVTQQRVVDQETGEVIAEAHNVRYISWIGKFIGIPAWVYVGSDPSDGRAHFSSKEVIKPKKD